MTFTVLTAELYHETNTFNVRPTTYESFASNFLYLREEAIQQRGSANTQLAGFLDAARSKDWTLIHTLSTSAPPSGKVTEAAFDHLLQPVLEVARNSKRRLDGVLLGLHGAMVTELSDDAEGEILSRIRFCLGDEIPIAITLDLHANVTKRMCGLASIIVSYKTYPHIDMRQIGEMAGNILHRTMAGEIAPRTILASRPMLDDPNGGRTDVGPMIDWVARGREYEKRPDVFAVSINSGFGDADIVEVGPTVLVTCQGDFAAHQRFAQKIADEIWESRFNVINTLYTVEEAVEIARQHKTSNGPVIIADFADNPGGGGYGDSTALLRAMLDADLKNACFGPMVDASVADSLQGAKIGSRVRVSLGGKTDPRFGGGPLELSATLKSVSNGTYTGDGPMIGGLTLSFGPSAVVDVNDVMILIVTHPHQMLDLQQFLAFGIDPREKQVVAVKSMQHFRAAFEPIASKVIVCDSGALCTRNRANFPYKRVPRPIYPLDSDMVFHDAGI